MPINKALLSSNDQTWETPNDFFNELDREFNFNLDPCCVPQTAKCKKFFTPDDDGLKKSWAGYRVFMNPPYGREIGNWIKKAYNETRVPGSLVVALIPARTDTKYFHEYIYKKPGVSVRFLRGRLRFGTAKNTAPFPSMVVIFRAPYDSTLNQKKGTRRTPRPLKHQKNSIFAWEN